MVKHSLPLNLSLYSFLPNQMLAQKACHPSLNWRSFFWVSSIGYFGLIFDQSLSWKPYILHLICVCPLKLNNLKKLSYSFYSFDQSSLIRIYKSKILFNGLPVYFPQFCSFSSHSIQFIFLLFDLILALFSYISNQ